MPRNALPLQMLLGQGFFVITKKNYSICFSNFILVSFFESVKKYVKKALASCLKGSTEFNFS